MITSHVLLISGTTETGFMSLIKLPEAEPGVNPPRPGLVLLRIWLN